MKLISIFRKNDRVYVTDDAGNVYLLKLIKKAAEKIDIQDSFDDLELKKKIITMVEELKIPQHYTGYSILIDCLYFTIKYTECRQNLSTNLYPRVAKLYDLATGSVPNTFTPLISNWCRTAKYSELFSKKNVSPKKFLLTLTDYFLSQNR